MGFISQRMFLGLVTFVLGAGPICAQINPFRESLPFLQNSDYALLSARAEELYAGPNPQVGNSRNWKNDATGNSGTVRVTKVYEWRGLPCRQVEHRIVGKAVKDPVTIHSDRCRIASGEWKLRYD